jgi:hypothetical protein
MGCVLSVDPKVDEILKAMEKDKGSKDINIKPQEVTEECDDFEEGYSDDELFLANDEKPLNDKINAENSDFKSWIIDICFKNMGWIFKGNEVIVSKKKRIIWCMNLLLYKIPYI